MLDRICVAYDDGVPAGAALAVALRFAERSEADLTLVHVAEPPVEEPVAPGDEIGFDLLGFTDERRWQARLLAIAADASAAAASDDDPAWAIDARTVAGDARRELPDLTAATGAAMVAVGAPRSGCRALLHRSVSQHLVDHATRPVLLTRTADLRDDGAVMVCLRGSRRADARAVRAGQRLAAAIGAPWTAREVPPNADAAGYFLQRCEREQPLAAVIGEEEPTWRSRRHHPERVLPRRADCPVLVVGHRADGPLVADELADAPPGGEPSWASC